MGWLGDRGAIGRVGAVVVSVVVGIFMATAVAAPASADPDADRDAVVQTVEARLAADLGKPVTLVVKTLNIDDGWAMVDGKLYDIDGELVDYTGTQFEVDAANGIKSKRYDGLLTNVDGQWIIVENAIGPTDVRWVGWRVDYPVAPAWIFDVPMP